MKTYNATDAKNKFGQLLEDALVQPVGISKKGRTVAFLVSASEYKRLTAIDEAELTKRALSDDSKGYLSEEETKNLLDKISPELS